ncbi:cytochrome P450 [Gymnopus androsaceus JB14]|uniref:Cytochrome P450 n=1 Tax=Gymnopus androsaceus JB14 TaxID=1447944 RepID=A0A6A4H6L9_9AGAR|nr:cytochrome P450 [Gymnopus androsaceus JB14]
MSPISLTPLSQALSLGAIFLLTLVIPKFIRWRARMNKLNAIPTVGSSGFFSSYESARRYKEHAREIILEGYQKYPGQAFKIPHVDRWEVIVSGKEMIEDMKKASDMDLSFEEAARETLQSDYTLGAAPAQDPYHITVVRTPLTRNLGARFDDIREEIVLAMEDQIPAKASEWIKVPMLYTTMKIISRTSNRFFVGAPLCRDPDYINLNIEYTVNAVMGAQTLRRYPTILKPIVRQLKTNVPASVKRATKHLEPLILERLRKEEEYGSSEWPDKPNDLISWLLDEAQGERRKNIVYNIVARVLNINFGAIHTTSITFTSSLFHLASNPELVQTLREEVEPIVKELGWTKAAMGQMRKLDSFMKETQRLSGNIGATSMGRMALRDFTFSNGTVIPAGTIVCVAAYAMNRDDEIYEEADKLNPFRFSDMRAQEGESTKHQMAGADPSYVLFGGGRHMCPGRFFAVNELKALLAHVLVTYDLKFENGGEYPPDEWRGAGVSPSRSTMVMFRKRVA